MVVSEKLIRVDSVTLGKQQAPLTMRLFVNKPHKPHKTRSGEAQIDAYRFLPIWGIGHESIIEVYLDNRSFSIGFKDGSFDKS